MNRRNFLATGIGLSATLALQACGSASDSDDTSANSNRLLARQTELDKLVSEFVSKQGVPGAAVALLDTKNAINAVAGVRVLGRPENILNTDLFHVGSNAKSMLAMLALKSAELGELQLETPIYDLVPGLRTSGLPAYGRVNLEQLLSHRTGVEPLLDVPSIEEVLPRFDGNAREQRRQALAFLTSRQPLAVPGNEFLYSNGGYAVAAAVLEHVTNKSFEQLISERLFGPLGIVATVGWPAATNPAAPYGHYFSEGRFTAFGPDEPLAQFRDALTPAGNVSMSVLDYTKYLRAHLSALKGDSPKVLTKANYDRMHRAIANTQFGYALGWATDGKDKLGAQLDYHYGSTDIFGCFALLQPSKNRAVAVMVNGEKPPFEEPMTQLAYGILALLD